MWPEGKLPGKMVMAKCWCPWNRWGVASEEEAGSQWHPVSAKGFKLHPDIMCPSGWPLPSCRAAGCSPWLRMVLTVALKATAYVKVAFFLQVTSLSCRTSSKGSRASWECSSLPKARAWWIINRETRCKAWWCSIQPCRLIRYHKLQGLLFFLRRVRNWIKFSCHRMVFITSLGKDVAGGLQINALLSQIGFSASCLCILSTFDFHCELGIH